MEPISIIITGSTGMVGEGVLIEALSSPFVKKVLVINRRSCGYMHPKLEEVIHKDFFHLEPLEEILKPYDACLFCLGVSSVGMDEENYFKMTHTLTTGFAAAVLKQNPAMIFSYISGTGTDSSEKGRMMWARVKGKTENDLMAMPFRKVFAFRPGLLKASPGQKHTLKVYKYLGWMYPVFKLLGPGRACSIAQLGQSMIRVAVSGYEKKILEVKDIIRTANLKV